ncbi:helix-turn-helix domain-containing protein [Neobacillus jeddahensis]|uniref:helix-turn-helix domain-containing protein n=1 Tax=Neobacillus jeddahensis TaxID=1461580 RepID=UPI0005AA4033|nr:helix-turn-helix domain-containing protein [Neobacillus jeddahensis]
MFNRNQDIKEAAKDVPNWAIAEKLGVSDNTYYRLLRKELSEGKKQEILIAINKVKEELTEEVH